VALDIEPVQDKPGREREDQNQYQRVDAHAHAPVPLQVRDIRTGNAPGNVTGVKYLPGVAKISQIASTQLNAGQSLATPIQVRAPVSSRERKAPAPYPGARPRAVIRLFRSAPVDRAASALISGDSRISFRVPPVQSETGRERNYQNQYQRFDGHANAPVACWRHGSTKTAHHVDATKIFAGRCKNPTDRTSPTRRYRSRDKLTPLTRKFAEGRGHGPRAGVN
jgi:hypothetical protein